MAVEKTVAVDCCSVEVIVWVVTAEFITVTVCWEAVTIWTTDEVLKLETVAALSDSVTMDVWVAYAVRVKLEVAGFNVVCLPTVLVLVTTT